MFIVSIGGGGVVVIVDESFIMPSVSVVSVLVALSLQAAIKTVIDKIANNFFIVLYLCVFKIKKSPTNVVFNI